MTITPSSMILNALIANGEKIIGGTLSSAEQTHYLEKLNAMLESWSLQRGWCYQLLEENFSLTNNVTSYTIGSGGTFNTTRPNTIVAPCFVRDSGNYDKQLTIISVEAYGTIGLKSSGVTYPEYLSYDNAYSSGLGTIRIYPAPQSGLTLYINSWKQLQSFATISTTLAMPPGYQRAIESNFAIECASGFTSVSPETLQIAKESRAAVKSLNLPSMVMEIDSGIVGTSRSRNSIITGP